MVLVRLQCTDGFVVVCFPVFTFDLPFPSQGPQLIRRQKGRTPLPPKRYLMDEGEGFWYTGTFRLHQTLDRAGHVAVCVSMRQVLFLSAESAHTALVPWQGNRGLLGAR